MGISWYLKRIVPDGLWWRDQPFWYSETFSGPYPGGKADYWSEAGYEDPVLKAGKFRVINPIMREDDPHWQDPAVLDGQAYLGVAGRDNEKIGGQYLKWDHAIPHEEYCKFMYENNPTIQNIYAKWDISKEHPGLKYVYDLQGSNRYIDKKDAGRIMEAHRESYIWPDINPFHRWPRFFDAPMGEGCFTKTAAAAKWSFCAALVWALVDHGSEGMKPKKFMQHVKRIGQISVLPVSMAMLWASTSCLMCSARKVDDYRNLLVGSLAAGTLYGHAKGRFLLGFTATTYLAVGSIMWHAIRLSEPGFGGFNKARMHAEAPLLWTKSNMARPTPPDKLPGVEWNSGS